ncbi:MAG: Rpn family recombination-promoting nuclease/putative transposase [Lachnospiraceae bacterium]|nr:Rpn family recombination-promoting nuclease/putative transposase [Lachnospiraceae bacterium]
MSKNTTIKEKDIITDHDMTEETVRAFEKWSTAGIGNAFLFGKVMTSNTDLLLELLQYSLPEFHIQSITGARREVDVKLSMDAHGIRLDILATDDQGRRIDVEMQMRDEKNIPRRMRYYEGSIDQTILETGLNYNRLGDTVILFITPFDPFEGSGRYKYTFKNVCLEDPEVMLEDGVTKVVLNAEGRRGDIPAELKEFLQLVTGKTDSASYADGSFADRVQKQVIRARHNSEWRRDYVDWEMTLRNEREKGREEERAKTEEQRKLAEAERLRADKAESLAEAEKSRAEADKSRAEAEKSRAEAAESQAEAEKSRADAAEAEVRKLREQLKNLQTEMSE